MSCRICLEEEGPFVHPCLCKGSSGYVHSKCLAQWVEQSKKTHCEICKHEYYKSEVMACNTNRCCSEFFKCRVTTDADMFFRKFGGIIFCTSTISIVFLDVDYMVIASCISTLLMTVVLLAYAIHHYDSLCRVIQCCCYMETCIFCAVYDKRFCILHTIRRPL